MRADRKQHLLLGGTHHTAVQSAKETRAEVAESEVASESVGPRIYDVLRLTTYLTRDAT